MDNLNDKKRNLSKEDLEEQAGQETFSKYIKFSGGEGKPSATTVAQAHDCLRMHFVNKPEDLIKIPQNGGFPVDYLHQIFGENEEIKGYKKLSIDIYISSAQLLPYVQISYFSREPEADDILDLLTKGAFHQGIISERERFMEILSFDSKFKPGGQKLLSYKIQKDLSSEFEVYENSLLTPGFLDYMYRLESFVPFFIETGSLVDEEDNLYFYLVYRKTHFNTHEFVGFANSFIFHQGLDKKKRRISQFLILPPFQRQGHGEKLLEVIYNLARSDPECVEITVEECSLEFQGLRDYFDIKTSLKENCFPLLEQYKNGQLIDSVEEYQNLKKHTLPSLKQVKEKLKIIPSQVKRIFEILLFSKINLNNQQLMEVFNKDIKEKLEKLKREEFDPFSNRKVPFLCFEGKLEKIVPEKIYKRITKEKMDETLGLYFNELMQQYAALREKLERMSL